MKIDIKYALRKYWYKLLFDIGLCCLLFFAPLIVIMFLKDHFLISLYVQNGEEEYLKYAPLSLPFLTRRR